MSKFKRIWYVISGIFIIIFSVLMIIFPDVAFWVIPTFIALWLFFKGLKQLIYYLTMANHMVGGKSMLFYGIIMLDLGIFAVSISERSRALIIIYLIAGHLFSGALDVVRAVRNKKEGYSSWRMDLMQGIVNLLLAAVCIIFSRSIGILVFIYFSGVIYSALLRIISAFRKTAVVYIQ